MSRMLTAARREGLPGLGPMRSAGDPRNRGKRAGQPAASAADPVSKAASDTGDSPPLPVPPEIAEWMRNLTPRPVERDANPS